MERPASRTLVFMAWAAPGIMLVALGVSLDHDSGTYIFLAGASLIGAAIGSLFRLAFVGALLGPVIGPGFYWLGVVAWALIHP